MEEEVYRSIDRYLANEMTADEQLSFEARLENDHDLLEKLEIYRSASTALQNKFKTEEREVQFKNNIAQITAEHNDSKEAKTINIKWYTWAAAASVALLCAVVFYSTLSKPSYKEYAVYEPIALAERGNEDAIKLEAQEAFNNHQYERASHLFAKLLEQDKNNSELQLYQGISLLERNRISEANTMFNEVRISKSVFSSKAIWMLALSALKEKDYKKCKSYLLEIPQGSEEYDNAQALLDEL
jgi:cytochrome c-type biogenesis protein CcmH/NrfG